jgi:hypothetical protein
MRFSELEDEYDVVRYYAEVFNPLGYLFFIFDKDRDYYEKMEHAFVASGIISTAFHLVHHLGTGNTWSTLPPRLHRFLSMKGWSHQMVLQSARRGGNIALRLAGSPAAAPMVLLLAAMYVGAQVRPGENQYEIDRVARAIDYTRGTRDHWWDTSWLVSHGYFHESPHHGDHWYSFNPQDIDGSHR